MPDNLIRLAATLLKPTLGMRHVFMYADLLDEGELRRCCPEPTFVTMAYYEGRRLFANSDGRISIEGRANSRVHGVVWSIPEPGLAVLDLFFDMPSVHDRFGCFARTDTGRLCVSEFYAARNRSRGLAASHRVRDFQAAARTWSFPEEYLAETDTWSQAAPTGRASV